MTRWRALDVCRLEAASAEMIAADPELRGAPLMVVEEVHPQGHLLRVRRADGAWGGRVWEVPSGWCARLTPGALRREQRRLESTLEAVRARLGR